MDSAALDLIAGQAAELTVSNHERIEVMERMERLHPTRGISPAQDVEAAEAELNLSVPRIFEPMSAGFELHESVPPGMLMFIAAAPAEKPPPF